MNFKRPTIGPKDFIVVGQSGWPERFERVKCEAALRIFLGPLPLADLVKNFAEEQRLARREKQRHETLWGDVEGYLTRIMGGRRHSMTPHVVIGFWGATILYERELEAARVN
jgi:hypothetical protein